jgi:hypothetical protein
MTTSIAMMTIFASAPCAAERLLFDFGNTASPTGAGWNDILRTTIAHVPVVDDSGTAFGTARLDITDAFYTSAEPSQSGTEMPAGDAAGYPVTATDDYLFGHTSSFGGEGPNPLGQLTLSSLDPMLLYDFTFFASRSGVADNREALYTVHGTDSTSVVLNASDNDSEVAVVIGVEPDSSGEIVVDVEPGPANDSLSGFYYLGLMQVDTYPAPEPSSGVLASALLYGAWMGRRRQTRFAKN